MKNLDFKMRERFHRREQDEDRREAIELRKLAKMKAAQYAEDADRVEDKVREQDGDFFQKQLKRFNIKPEGV